MNSEPRGRLIDNKQMARGTPGKYETHFSVTSSFLILSRNPSISITPFKPKWVFLLFVYREGQWEIGSTFFSFLFFHICLKVEPVCVRKKGLTLGAQHEIPFLSLLSSNAKCINYPRKLTAEPNDRNLPHSPNQLPINPT